MTEPLPDEIGDALWAEAYRRAAAIRRFLEFNSSQSTVTAIADLASELHVSQATTYRLLRRFEADRTVMSLIETNPADGLVVGAGRSNGLRSGGAEAAASSNDRKASRRPPPAPAPARTAPGRPTIW